MQGFLETMGKSLRARDEALIASILTILERNLPLNAFRTMPADLGLRDRLRAVREKLHGTAEPHHEAG